MGKTLAWFRTWHRRRTRHFRNLKSLIRRKLAVIVIGTGLTKLITESETATWTGFLQFALEHLEIVGRAPADPAWREAAKKRTSSGIPEEMMSVFQDIEAALGPGGREDLLEAAFGGLEKRNPSPAQALAAWNCPLN